MSSIEVSFSRASNAISKERSHAYTSNNGHGVHEVLSEREEVSLKINTLLSDAEQLRKNNTYVDKDKLLTEVIALVHQKGERSHMMTLFQKSRLESLCPQDKAVPDTVELLLDTVRNTHRPDEWGNAMALLSMMTHRMTEEQRNRYFRN